MISGIHKIITDKEYKKIDDFFSTMWKELFDIECRDQIEKYKFCDIYYFEENFQIVSAIIYSNTKLGKNYIWRFGTLEYYRGKGLGTKLLQYVLKKYDGDIFLSADNKQVGFYENNGFEKTGINSEIGNTLAYGMVYKNDGMKIM